MLKFTVSSFSWRCRWSSNLFGSLVDQRAVGSGGPYFSSVIVFRLFFLAGVLFYVGDASVRIKVILDDNLDLNLAVNCSVSTFLTENWVYQKVAVRLSALRTGHTLLPRNIIILSNEIIYFNAILFLQTARKCFYFSGCVFLLVI
jgi:hypothetical protein